MISKKEDEVHTEPRGHILTNPGINPFLFGDPSRHKQVGGVLAEARELIYGHREQDYGPPRKNFKDIANLWSAYLTVINRTNITPADVAMMMTLLKMARCAKQSMPVRDSRDSVVDMAGYVGLLERLEE